MHSGKSAIQRLYKIFKIFNDSRDSKDCRDFRDFRNFYVFFEHAKLLRHNTKFKNTYLSILGGSIDLSTYLPWRRCPPLATYLRWYGHQSFYLGKDGYLSTYLGKDGYLSTYFGGFHLPIFLPMEGRPATPALPTYLRGDCHLSACLRKDSHSSTDLHLSTYQGKYGHLSTCLGKDCHLPTYFGGFYLPIYLHMHIWKEGQLPIYFAKANLSICVFIYLPIYEEMATHLTI